MKRIIYLLACIALISCNSDDDESCLKPLSSARVLPSTQIAFKQIYTDSNYNISISPFMTPNGDGFQDVIVLYIEDLSNNSFYITSNLSFTGVIDPNTTEDPTAFFTDIRLSVNNECDFIYGGFDINDYTWRPDINSPFPEGNYILDFKIDMVNGDPILVTNNFDLYYPVIN